MHCRLLPALSRESGTWQGRGQTQCRCPLIGRHGTSEARLTLSTVHCFNVDKRRSLRGAELTSAFVESIQIKFR